MADDPTTTRGAADARDASDAPDTVDGTAAGSTAVGTGSGGSDPRSVAVPSRVYKAVTVFSTLFAVVSVVTGFAILDVATRRASLSLARADPLLALLGLGLIVAGAVTYAFSTRFRAEGMENAKDDTDEPQYNG